MVDDKETTVLSQFLIKRWKGAKTKNNQIPKSQFHQKNIVSQDLFLYVFLIT